MTLRLPDKVFQLLQRPPDEIVQAVRLAAAIHWYERGVLPQDKALEIAGLERGKEVLVLGMFDHLELWQPQRYEAHIAKRKSSYEDSSRELLRN